MQNPIITTTTTLVALWDPFPGSKISILLIKTVSVRKKANDVNIPMMVETVAPSIGIHLYEME